MTCTNCQHLYSEFTDFGVNCYCCHPTQLTENTHPLRPSVKFIGHSEVLHEKRPESCPLPEAT